MKIEKINKNQIRCTLNKSDLADRDLHLSELAYGTDKARELFKEMMQQASYEFGFEAEDIPLMIEAIPVSNDCLILIVTKVTDPDELDTRFSKFTSSMHDNDDDYDDDYEDDDYEDDDVELLQFNDEEDYDSNLESVPHNKPDIIDGAAGILDFLSKLDISAKVTNNSDFIPLPETLFGASAQNKRFPQVEAQPKAITTTEKEEPASKKPELPRVFSFNSLSEISSLSEIIPSSLNVANSLYKDFARSKYYLIVDRIDTSLTDYMNICKLILEYGKKEHVTYFTRTYFIEHYDLIIENNALQVLKDL